MILNFYKRLSRLQQCLLQIGIGLAFVVVYLSPYLTLGQDTPTLIHDNMDCSISFWQIYHESNPFWNSGPPSPRFLSGELPALAGPNLKLANLPYSFLPPFAAYVVLQFLTRLVAFVGMWLLLRSVFPKRSTQTIPTVICTGVAILFAFLPHCPPTSFCIPALPLLAWALWKIARREDRWWHWAVLCLLPLFTPLFMAPVFLLMLVGAAWLVDVVMRRRGNWRWFGALALVSILYCVCEYDLVLSTFASHFKSHRIEFQSVPVSLKAGLREALSNFCDGQYHVATHHRFLLPLFALTACLAMAEWGRSLAQRSCRVGGSKAENTAHTPQAECDSYLGIMVGALILAGLIALWYGLYQWTPFVALRQSVPVLNMVQWDRLHWLHPLVWYVGLAGLLMAWSRMLRPRYAVSFITLVLLWQGMVLVWHADYTQPLRNHEPTWRQFYAHDQFAAIQQFIGKPAENYRVASLAIHPSIALYNGFYCLDGYCNNYSLDYKKSFRQVIAKELDKSDDLKSYFDTWGSRCYLFSSEVGHGFVTTKEKTRSISGLALDLNAFAKLGGQYILSAVQIDNPDKSGLELLKVFDDPQSAWRIWLYAPLKTPA